MNIKITILLIIISLSASAQYDAAKASFTIAVSGFVVNECIVHSDMPMNQKNKTTATIYASTAALAMFHAWVLPELKQTTLYKRVKRKLKIKRK